MEARTADFASSFSTELLNTRDTAIMELARLANSKVAAPEGPVQVGIEKKILTSTSVSELASHYVSAFGTGIQCFPYFTANGNARK